jgi:hypothetical protein
VQSLINIVFKKGTNLNYLINFIKFFLSNNSLKEVFLSLWLKIVFNTKFIQIYYLRNEHLWLDGFLFDFLQKKTADIWVRKFVIYTGFLFSERLVFDCVVKLYMDYLVWYMHKFTIFEVSNVFEMLSTIVYFAITIFFILILIIVVV